MTLSGSLSSFTILTPGHDRDWHLSKLSKQAGHIKLLSLPLCSELMVDLRLVLFLQQIWVCQQQVFGCVWESDNSSQLTQQSLQWEAVSLSILPANISLSKLILAAHCLQTWAGPPSWQQLKPLTQGTQVLAPGPLLFNLLFAALAALQPTVIHE